MENEFCEEEIRQLERENVTQANESGKRREATDDDEEEVSEDEHHGGIEGDKVEESSEGEEGEEGEVGEVGEVGEEGEESGEGKEGGEENQFINDDNTNYNYDDDLFLTHKTSLKRKYKVQK